MSLREFGRGDTASIVLQRRNEQGNLEPYPPDQVFDVVIRQGHAYGVLLSSNGVDTAKSFSGIEQGFKYIAADTIGVDSGQVTIVVSMPGLPSRPSKSFTARGTHKGKIDSKKDEGKDGPSSSDSFEYDLPGVAKQTVRKPILVVATPTENQKITAEPAMPILSAITAHVEGYTGQVTYHASIRVEWRPSSTDYVTDGFGETDDITAPGTSETSMSFVHWKDSETGLPAVRGGDDVELTVYATVGSQAIAKTKISPFKIIGLNLSNARFKEELSAGYTGDDVLAFQVVTYLESNFRQFYRPGHGLTIRGSDFDGDANDFGVCQIQKPGSDDIIWDWRANIQKGRELFQEKKRFARDYHLYLRRGIYGRRGPDHPLWKEQLKWYKTPKGETIKYNAQPLTPTQQLKDVFQLYNKGAFWRWCPNDDRDPQGSGVWSEEPVNEYGRNAYWWFQNIPLGVLPEYWNTDFNY